MPVQWIDAAVSATGFALAAFFALSAVRNRNTPRLSKASGNYRVLNRSRNLKVALLLAALCAAAASPWTGGSGTKAGDRYEVAFLLDVSRSMDADA